MGVVPRPHERHHRYAEESPVFDRDSLVDTTEYIKYLFLALDPTSIMPGRTAAKKRTAQRDWMIEQKTKASKQQAEEEEDKDSDNDSGVEDKEVEEVEETIAEAVPEEKPAEDDGPVEDWTKKELMDECNSLEISNKGNKNALIERIKEAWANKKPAIIEEVAVEKVDEIEVAVEPETIEDKPVDDECTPVVADDSEAVISEPAVEESAPVEAEATESEAAKPEEEEEDAPIEEWTKKELVEECKNLGISDKGNKAALIEIIKETWANKKEIAESAAPLEAEDVPVAETEPEKPSETATEPEASEPMEVEEATETASTEEVD